jgi:hypothetical protein
MFTSAALLTAGLLTILPAPVLAPVETPIIAQIQHAPIPNLNGLTYHEARKKLIDAGWQPNYSYANYTGSNDSLVKWGNGPLFLELGYGELRYCSGTGMALCGFEFTDAYGNYLEENLK